MPDQEQLRRLGIDVKRRIDAIARGVSVHCQRYVAGQIKGKQFLAGLLDASKKVENQLDRLEVTMLDGHVEDMSGFNDNRRVLLGGREEDMSNLNTRDPLDADANVDFGPDG